MPHRALHSKYTPIQVNSYISTAIARSEECPRSSGHTLQGQFSQRILRLKLALSDIILRIPQILRVNVSFGKKKVSHKAS